MFNLIIKSNLLLKEIRKVKLRKFMSHKLIRILKMMMVMLLRRRTMFRKERINKKYRNQSSSKMHLRKMMTKLTRKIKIRKNKIKR